MYTGNTPDSKVHGANMGPTWVLSARFVFGGFPVITRELTMAIWIRFDVAGDNIMGLLPDT